MRGFVRIAVGFDLVRESEMPTSTMIHVRIDEKIKKEAVKTLEDIGLSVSDAVRMFLLRVIAEKQIPLALKVPNAETRSTIAEADAIAGNKRPSRRLADGMPGRGDRSRSSSVKHKKTDLPGILGNPDRKERQRMAERILESFELSDFGTLLKEGLDKTSIPQDSCENGS